MLRDVRRLRLKYDEGTGPQAVFPVLLDRETVSLWLYLPPGNDDLAQRLIALPCPSPEQEPGRLVKLSEEYHPARPPLRITASDSRELEISIDEFQFPSVGPDLSRCDGFAIRAPRSSNGGLDDDEQA